MADLDLLHGKRVLVVDDEPDILDTVVELLDMCQVTAAGTFEEARNLLGVDKFDIVVLDIMGVDGYSLLKTCTRLGIPTVMLTAHAFTPDNLIRSVEEGAMSYIPKEELPRLADFLTAFSRRAGRAVIPGMTGRKNFPPAISSAAGGQLCGARGLISGIGSVPAWQPENQINNDGFH